MADIGSGFGTSESIFHTPCAFNKKGASRTNCFSMTRSHRYNDGCIRTNCHSPLRACSACVALLLGNPAPVADPDSGLCQFHLVHPKTERPPLSLCELKNPITGRREWFDGVDALWERARLKSAAQLVEITAALSANASSGYGKVKVWDPEAEAYVSITCFEAFDIADSYRADGMGHLAIGEKMRISTSHLNQIFLLSGFLPEARHLISSHEKGMQFGVNRLGLIGRLLPQLQVKAVRDLLTGRMDVEGLERLCADPANRRPRTLWHGKTSTA